MSYEEADLVCEAGSRLRDEPRLADSRLARDRDDGSATRSEVGKHRLERRPLGFAAHEGCRGLRLVAHAALSSHEECLHG